MNREPQTDWKTFRLILLIGPSVMAVVAMAVGAWTTAIPLLLFALAAAALILLRGDRRRNVTLHLAIAALVVYQTLLLWSTADEPNLGVVWFMVIPALVALLGQRTHILVWTPITFAVTVYAWSMYSDYPVMAHAMTLPNLIGATLVVSAAAFGVVTQRTHREKALSEALEESQREAMDRRIAQTDALKNKAVITTFMGSMSHELRTPLTSIVLSADALDNTLKSTDQRMWTQNIRESADSLVLLLNDILELARGDAGAAGLKNELFDVENLLESVRAILQPIAAAKDVCLFIGAMPDVPCEWHGDPARVRQVLVNLANNALAHSQGTRVGLRARCEADQLQFVVSDNGIGIDEGDQERIFRPFHQLDGGKTASSDAAFPSGGNGLGLAIARDYVNAMGGQLSVESTPGEGAVFSFSLSPTAAYKPGARFVDRHGRRDGWPDRVWLTAECALAIGWGKTWIESWGMKLDPRAPVAIDLIDDVTSRLGSARRLSNRMTALAGADDGSDNASVNERPAHRPSPASPYRCAICDDDESILKIIAETLTFAGHVTETFTNGNDLIEFLAVESVDVVVLDVNLPVVSGVDILRELRRLPGEAGRTPVCMLSGAWNERENCIKAGADAYLFKPSSSDELVETVERLGGQRRLAVVAG
ncbi:MAG: hybrid sensor histidine kinase/response regulator [Pseudomonadota bacterium]